MLTMSIQREMALALASNLQRLMDHHALSQAQLAKKSGVGQRTLSTLLDIEHPLEMNPRSTTIEQLAIFFGLPTWQLLIPDLPLELLLTQRLAKLIEHYRDAPEDGRANIERVAEGEVRYAQIDRQGRRTGTGG